MSIRSEKFYVTGLAVLLISAAWLFVPTLANAFAIKAPLIVLGILILTLLRVSNTNFTTLAVPRPAATAALLLLLAAVSVTALFAANPRLALAAWVESFVFTLLIFGLLNIERIEDAQQVLESALLMAAAGVALFALKQFFFPGFLDPGFHALGKMKIYSTLGNPNLAALVMLPAVPVAVFRAWRSEHRARLSFAMLTFVLLAGLVATQSRHAFLALAVMVLAGLLWLAPLRVRRLLIVVLGIGAVLGLAVVFIVDLPLALIHSIKGRWFIWNTAAHVLWQHPLLGVGPGHFGLVHPEAQAQLFATGLFNNYFDNAALTEEAHNQFLHWGATSGLAGLLGFTVLLGWVLWNGWRSEAVRTHAPQLYLAVVGYLVAMLFVATLAYTTVALLFWLVLALVWRRSESAYPSVRFPVGARMATLIVLGALALLTLLWAMRDVRGGFHEARADRLLVERDLWGALREYQAGLAACPTCASLHRKHATALYLSGLLEDALAEARLAQRDSGDVALRILEGEILTRLNRLDEAVEVYKQISTTFPKMVSPRFILAQIYVLQGKRDAAESGFRAILDIEPSPYNLNLTSEKVELQKDIARQYLREREGRAARP